MCLIQIRTKLLFRTFPTPNSTVLNSLGIVLRYFARSWVKLPSLIWCYTFDTNSNENYILMIHKLHTSFIMSSSFHYFIPNLLILAQKRSYTLVYFWLNYYILLHHLRSYPTRIPLSTLFCSSHTFIFTLFWTRNGPIHVMKIILSNTQWISQLYMYLV